MQLKADNAGLSRKLDEIQAERSAPNTSKSNTTSSSLKRAHLHLLDSEDDQALIQNAADDSANPQTTGAEPGAEEDSMPLEKRQKSSVFSEEVLEEIRLCGNKFTQMGVIWLTGSHPGASVVFACRHDNDFNPFERFDNAQNMAQGLYEDLLTLIPRKLHDAIPTATFKQRVSLISIVFYLTRLIIRSTISS